MFQHPGPCSHGGLARVDDAPRCYLGRFAKRQKRRHVPFPDNNGGSRTPEQDSTKGFFSTRHPALRDRSPSATPFCSLVALETLAAAAPRVVVLFRRPWSSGDGRLTRVLPGLQIYGDLGGDLLLIPGWKMYTALIGIGPPTLDYNHGTIDVLV